MNAGRDRGGPDCPVCRALVAQREAARRTGRPDKVRACDRELARHPHRWQPEPEDDPGPRPRPRPRSRPGAGSRPAGLFASPDDVRIGATVYDRDYEMPGRVRNVTGALIEIERPTGFVWSVHFRRLRPGTEREERQLAALARLHRQRCRGLRLKDYATVPAAARASGGRRAS